MKKEREEKRQVGIELGIGSNEFALVHRGYKGEALTQNVE